MTTWLLLTAVLAIAAWYGIWSRHPGKARTLAVLAFLIASPAAGGSLLTSMGWAVPMYPYFSMPKGELVVVGVDLYPEEAIYVTLRLPEGPRLFFLPWDPQKASKLQRAMEGQEGEGQLKMRFKGERSEGEFYMEPNPAPLVEEKQPEPEGFVFEQ